LYHEKKSSRFYVVGHGEDTVGRSIAWKDRTVGPVVVEEDSSDKKVDKVVG
jgi:hypothetical protein